MTERHKDECPALCWFGGEEAFSFYQAEFDRLYHSAVIRDVLNRIVRFPKDSCRHVCFRRDHDKRGDRSRVLWSQERAECIGWILIALTDPTEIRSNHQNWNNDAYLLAYPSGERRRPAKRYYVTVAPDSDGRDVTFVTGYPVQQSYWDDARLPRKEGRGLIYQRPVRRW